MEAEVKLGLSAGEQVRLVANARRSALPFYEKLGYSLYGKLDGFPEENALNYYGKRLKKRF
jgi:hypothetical protein